MFSTDSTTNCTVTAATATTSSAAVIASDALSILSDSTLRAIGHAPNIIVHDVPECFNWATSCWGVRSTMPALPIIKEVIFHDGTHTTIRWADGTATDVSCGEGEEYNEYEGFCAAVVKKLFGGTGAAKREMREKNLTEQRRLAKIEEEKKRQEEAEVIARKKARSKRRYIKKMAKKMLVEEEIRRQAEELAKKMKETI